MVKPEDSSGTKGGFILLSGCLIGKMLKLTLTFVVLIACFEMIDAAFTDAQSSQIHTKLLSSGLDCIKDHPLSFDHIKAFREKKVPESMEAKCFIKCMFKSLGLMSENGKLTEKKAKENARTVFKEGDDMLPKVDEIISTCKTDVNSQKTVDGDKGCDRAKLAFQCFVKHAPKLGLDMNF